MRPKNSLHQSLLPTTLGGQLRRQAPRYAGGLVLLAAYQYAQYWFDTRLSRAIDAATHDDAALASRLGAMLIGVAIVSLGVRVFSRMAIFNAGRNAEYELRRALFDDVDAKQMNEVALFGWFIGNTDWSLYALHNIRLVRRLDGTILPIAYDLDFSGLVGTRYSTPDPRLGLRTVRERLYRGPCRTMEEYEPHLAVYREKEAEILALYESFPGLDSRYRQETTRFLKDAFALLKRPADLKVTLVDTCKRQLSV